MTMRTPFNKALSANTKEGAGKENSMNKEFKKILDAAAAIDQAQPELRAQYVKGLEAAQEAQKIAAQAKEEAETEEAFDKACNDERNAIDKAAFFERRIASLDFTPRMDEAEYDKYVGTVKTTVEKAAAAFCEVAEKAIDELAEAKAAYMSVVTDADKVLVALDDAANVLQSRYRYREVRRAGWPVEKIEDRNEWRLHALNYNRGSGKCYDLISKDGDNRNYKACAAWRAADNGGRGF